MRKAMLIGCSALALWCLGVAAQDKAPPSTADERTRFVAVTRGVIQAPLDKSKSADVKWALKWLGDVPDVNVDPCPLPLGDFAVSGHRHSATIFGIYVMSMGVYAIENRGKAQDPTSQFVAGVEGALRGYRAILRAEPGSRADDLEELLTRQRAGGLREFVQQASAGCTAQPEGPGSGKS